MRVLFLLKNRVFKQSKREFLPNFDLKIFAKCRSDSYCVFSFVVIKSIDIINI